MKDTEIVRNENHDLIMSIIDLLQLKVMTSMFNYNKMSNINPCSHELHEYMERINLKYSYITISSRLSELRSLKFVTSYKVKDNHKCTRNKLTTKGNNFMFWHKRNNPRFRRVSP